MSPTLAYRIAEMLHGNLSDMDDLNSAREMISRFLSVLEKETESEAIMYNEKRNSQIEAMKRNPKIPPLFAKARMLTDLIPMEPYIRDRFINDFVARKAKVDCYLLEEAFPPESPH